MKPRLIFYPFAPSPREILQFILQSPSAGTYLGKSVIKSINSFFLSAQQAPLKPNEQHRVAKKERKTHGFVIPLSLTLILVSVQKIFCRSLSLCFFSLPMHKSLERRGSRFGM